MVATRRKYLSPCCAAHAWVRKISLSRKTIALRCSKCQSLYMQSLEPTPALARAPHLRLITNS